MRSHKGLGAHAAGERGGVQSRVSGGRLDPRTVLPTIGGRVRQSCADVRRGQMNRRTVWEGTWQMQLNLIKSHFRVTSSMKCAAFSSGVMFVSDESARRFCNEKALQFPDTNAQVHFSNTNHCPPPPLLKTHAPCPACVVTVHQEVVFQFPGKCVDGVHQGRGHGGVHAAAPPVRHVGGPVVAPPGLCCTILGSLPA